MMIFVVESIVLTTIVCYTAWQWYRAGYAQCLFDQRNGVTRYGLDEKGYLIDAPEK